MAVGALAPGISLDLIDRLCATIDRAFEEDTQLAKAFPDSAAAKGQPSTSLKAHIEDRLGHDRRYAIDDSKIASELGFTRAHSIDDGLEQTVRWYLDNADWWRSVSARQATN